MTGKRYEWPWSDRGRSACTPESVRADLVRLCVIVAQAMREARGPQKPTVVVGEKRWL